MFRLGNTTRLDGVYLTIEGALNSESVETIELACLKAIAEHAKVIVILKDVTEIDANGIAFLKRIGNKAQVRATGIFSQYLLENILREFDAQHPAD
jgi:hypothetical protein